MLPLGRVNKTQNNNLDKGHLLIRWNEFAGSTSKEDNKVFKLNLSADLTSRGKITAVRAHHSRRDVIALMYIVAFQFSRDMKDFVLFRFNNWIIYNIFPYKRQNFSAENRIEKSFSSLRFEPNFDIKIIDETAHFILYVFHKHRAVAVWKNVH